MRNGARKRLTLLAKTMQDTRETRASPSYMSRINESDSATTRETVKFRREEININLFR